MHVLTIYAHPNPKSFCHAVLDHFTAGLREAGHSTEVVDLYAIGFDPVHRSRDTPSWLTESIPDDLLDRMRLRESLLEGAGGPLRRFAIIQTTIWDQRAYDTGLREAMCKVIDEYTLTYPGIKKVEHELFYAVHGADDDTRRGYLERARALGLNF